MRSGSQTYLLKSVCDNNILLRFSTTIETRCSSRLTQTMNQQQPPHPRPFNADRSLVRLMLARQYGLCLDTKFAKFVSRRVWGSAFSSSGSCSSNRRNKKELLMSSASTPTNIDTANESELRHLEIVSPHTRAVSCLDMDRRENRFLLVASADATVSLFDLSPWGNQRSMYRARSIPGQGNDNEHNDHTTYHPIAQSIRQPPAAATAGINGGDGHDHDDPFAYVPSGHASRISYAQWYPTDPGIFLTASATSSSGVNGGGEVLLWDTARMKPVLNIQPFRSDLSLFANNYSTNHDAMTTTGIVTADVRGGNFKNRDSPNNVSVVSSTPMLATASWNLSPIKLVDLSSPVSGPAAFTLTGHVGGVTSLQWSPTNINVLVSGGHDGTIRLWDIRKSGSRAMITTLNRERIVRSSNSMFAAAFARAPIVSEHNNDTSSSSSSPPIFVGSGPNFKSDYSHLRLTDEENDKKRRRQLKKQNKQQHGGKDNNMMINKRQRNAAYAAKNLNPSNYDAVESLSSGVSHSGHVAGLQFTKDGRYLASVGALDGELAVWDLMRGARLASKFVVAGGLPATTPRQRGRVPLCIEDNNNGSSWDSTIWIPREEKILAFSLMDGGCPTQSLSGSLSGIESLTINRFDKTLFSGSQDGMVLSWGVQPYRNHAILDRQQQEEDIDKW